MNRRVFLQSATAFASLPYSPTVVAAAAKPVRLGVIGAGSRGQEDMRQFLRVPGVSIQAMYDIYPPRVEQVKKLVGKDVPNAPSLKALLERDDLDAILVASPLYCHAQHVIAAARSGRPVYGEKALGFTVEENMNILQEVRRHKTVFQIGHQYRYAAWSIEAMRRIRAGDIGTPTHAYAYWHRNGNWRRSVPQPDPGNKLEYLINWRLYRETSGGLGTELGSHHIDMANWVFGEQPKSVLGTTSICRYHDGRTTGDNEQSVFSYSNGRRLVFSALTDNAKTGCEFWVYGTEGSIQITIEDATIYFEKNKKSNAPTADRPGVETVVERGIVTGASYSSHGEMPYRGPGEKLLAPGSLDPTLAAVQSFIGAVRREHAVEADVEVGFGSSIACAVAHDAVYAEEKRLIPAMPFA